MKKTVRVVNLRGAKAQLSRLVEQAADGESFIIAKRGKPLEKVVALDAPSPTRKKRLGFLAAQIVVPDDFGTMGAPVIE